MLAWSGVRGGRGMQLGRNCGMLCLQKQEWKEHCPLLSDMLSYIPKYLQQLILKSFLKVYIPQNRM